MTISLTWKDRNLDTTGTRVYRSETPFEAAALPAVLATLPAGTMQFIDEEVLRNKLYYYRLGVLKGGEEVISDLKVVGKFPYTGPGPQTLLRGDFKDGYFGTLTLSEMFTPAEIYQACGIPGSLLGVVTQWFKYAIDGKILFIPDGYISQSVSWNQLYNLGLVYGVDGVGSNPTATPTNQKKLLNRNEHEFKVRLLVGSSNPSAVAVRTADELKNSEYGRIFYRSCVEEGPYPKWNDLQLGQLIKLSSGMDVLVQDNGPAANAKLVRRYNSLLLAGTIDPSFAYAGWMPVLELTL